MLQRRIITAIVLSSVISAALACSHIPYVTSIAVFLICAVGIYELYRSAGLTRYISMVVCSIIIDGFICAWQPVYYPLILAISMAIAFVYFSIKMRKIDKSSFTTLYQVFPLTVMLPLFMRSLITLRSAEYGLWYVLYAILVCVITDSTAYLFGSKFGRRKLAPKVSPNKSVEGSMAGIFVTILALMVVAGIWDVVLELEVQYGVCLIYLLLSSVVSQFGDLAMSAIKRMSGIKDFGNIFPGHGGMLDRVDSILFAAPFTLLFIYLSGGMFI